MASPPAPRGLDESKAQHYIPEFYLKGFTDKRKVLWVCERFKPIRESKPKEEANRPDYYSHSENGERDETFEDVLAKVESQAAPIVRKMANPQYSLTLENASHLILFIGFTFARVPAWRELLDKVAAKIAKDSQLELARDKDKYYESLKIFEKATGTVLKMGYEELRQFTLKGEFEIEQKSAGFNLHAMFNSAISIVNQLKMYGYESLYAPKGKFFVSSDSPVFTVHPDGDGTATVGMGFGWPDTEVFFPLNKRTCFRMVRGIQAQAKVLKPERVDQINNLTMATATRYLYSCEGYRRIGRLFDERGCKIRFGRDAFRLERPSSYRILFK